MANRVTVPVTNFENLSPPWSLNSLDNDLLALQGAINDSSVGYVITGTDVGAANAYNIATPTLGMPSSYQAGMTVAFFPANSNTATTGLTLAVGGLSPQPLVSAQGAATIAIGSLLAGRACLATYIGTGFQLLTNGGVPLVGSVLNAPATSTLNCIYASMVSMVYSWTTTGNSTIVLNNIPTGIMLSIVLVNLSGGTSVTYKFSGTDYTGAALAIYGYFSQVTTGVGSTDLTAAHTLGPFGNLCLVGAVNSGGLYFNT